MNKTNSYSRKERRTMESALRKTTLISIKAVAEDLYDRFGGAHTVEGIRTQLNSMKRNLGLEHKFISRPRPKRKRVVVTTAAPTSASGDFVAGAVLAIDFGIPVEALDIWREEGQLGFLKVGPTVMYQRGEVEKLVQKSYVPATK